MASADIEQMNKLRKSLGLPLLNVPSTASSDEPGPKFKEHSASDESDEEPASTLETREAAGYENFQRLQDEEKRRIQREERKKEIQRARDAATRFTKLEGRGLGELDTNGDLDAKAWLKGQRKRQAKIERERAEKLAEELAEREKEAAVTYDTADLAGVRVAHEIGDFENGESEQVLTLQDAQVGEDASDQDDVLESAEVVARDKLKEKLDLKKRKAYDVNEESNENGLLSQYDEKKRKAFTLDGQGATVEERQAKRLQIGERLKELITLDMPKPESSSDYQEIRVKKPKKAKKKTIRQRFDEDEDDFGATTNEPETAMEVDQPQIAKAAKTKSTEKGFEDDEDLARALAFSRRAALKKQKRKPEDIIKQLKEEEEAEMKEESENDGGIILDDTTSFLDNLSSRPREDQPQPAIHQSIEGGVELKHHPDDLKEGDEDVDMSEVYNITEDETDLLERLRREQSTHTPEISHSGLTEEQTLEQGLGATLNLLKQRGLVKATDAGDKNTLYKDRQRFIVEARLREYDNEQRARHQRERDRQSGKMTGMSVKEREEKARWQNTQREHQSSIQAAATFNREYKPDVQIKHVDENGRVMNMKEAFKHLSHQFHGKGSGKQKTEKQIKKIEDEQRRMAASVLDSSQATGMNNALGTQTKKNKEAGVRLA